MLRFLLGSPRPIVQLAGLVLASLLILGACAPLSGPTVKLTPNLEPAAPTPIPLTGAAGVGGVPETPADAAAGLPVGQAFVDLSSNGAAVPHWVLSAGEVEHLKTLLDRLPPIECPPIAEPAGYRGIVVVLSAGDQGVRHAYGGWVWRGSPAAMNPQTTCQLDPGREVERFLLNGAQPYLDPGVFSAVAAEMNRPLPIPLVTPSLTPTAAPEAHATAAGAAPPATLVDVALGGLVFVRADGALVRRTFSTDEDVVLLPPGAYAAEGDVASMVPIGWPLRASADARWLLVPTPDQGAWLVSWDGQVQRRINAERLSATWAPDNQRIVFIYQTGAPPRARDNDVYVQDVVSGGEARLLTRLSQPVGYIFWSPACPGLGSGGADACTERIAAVTCAKDAPDVVCTVWLLDAGSAASRALGQFRPAAIGIAPINFGWAPSGTAFYVGIAADGPLAFPVDGGGPRPLVGNLPGLAQRQPAAYPLLSPDGTRLAQLQPSATKQGGQALVILDVRENTAIHQSAPYPDSAAVAGWLNDDVVLIRYTENDAQILAGVNIASGETQKLVYSDVFIGSWRQLMTRSTEVSASEGRLVDQPGSGPAPDPVAHEAALVQAILPVNIAYPVCEWRELGQQGDEIYIWAVCLGLLPVGGKTGASLPAVLVLGADGSVHAVRLPGDGSQYAEDIKKLFPPVVRALIAEAQTYVPELVLRAERRLAAAQP